MNGRYTKEQICYPENSQVDGSCNPKPLYFLRRCPGRILLAGSVLCLHPTTQILGHRRDLVGLVLDGRTDALPDGQHTCPHLGSHVVVLEVLAIVTRWAGVDLGAGADHGDPED